MIVYMQFKVPQFIDIEDKIFGPFTFKQFAYLAGGTGGLYLCFKLLPFPFSAVFGLAFGGVGAALAFYKYNDKPFINFVESFVKYYFRSRLYIWQKKKAAIAQTPESWGIDTARDNTPVQGDMAMVNQNMYLHQKQNVNRFAQQGAQQQAPVDTRTDRALAPKTDRVLRPSLTEDKLKTLSRSLDIIDTRK